MYHLLFAMHHIIHFQKILHFSFFILHFICASCTVVKNYYILDGKEVDMKHVNSLNASLPATDVGRGGGSITYDVAPPVHIREARLVKSAIQYDPTDSETFPVYTDVQTVAEPVSDRTIDCVALWCTKDATYLAYVTEQHWGRHYYQLKSDTYIRDVKTGKKYFVVGHPPFPLDVSYFINGLPGQHNCTVCIFPPLPISCTVIDIVESDVTDKVKNAPGWGGGIKLYNVPVSKLQSNQYITKFQEVKVVD